MGSKPKTETTETAERTVVWIGNRDAVEVTYNDDGNQERRALPKGKRATKVIVGESAPGVPLTLMEAAHDITHPGRGVWATHSDGNPAWVASTNPILAELLASHWGCEVRDPEPGAPSADTAEEV